MAISTTGPAVKQKPDLYWAHVRRNKSFDIFRIVFALLVILSHAAELVDGNKSRELLARWTHTYTTFGNLAVDGFFLLSGYLIARSWEQNPKLTTFLRNRLLRIVPGYLVAVVITTTIVGLLAPGIQNFFHHLGFVFLRSVFALSYPKTPSVFPGLAYPSANGALWTINYEFRCYLFVAIAGLLGFFQKRILWLCITAAWLAGFIAASVTSAVLWSPHLVLLFGESFQDYRLVSAYCVGVSFYIFRDKIVFRPSFAIAAALAILLCPHYVPTLFEAAFILMGGYLLFYTGQLRLALLSSAKNFPDISYGIYIYGWPVESLLIWYHRGGPWSIFLQAAPICVLLGWLSWHLVERPMLLLKRKSSSSLPSS